MWEGFIYKTLYKTIPLERTHVVAARGKFQPEYVNEESSTERRS